MRRNLVNVPEERFRPPALQAASGTITSLANRLRRFVDIQTGTIWRDVRANLRDSQGAVLDIGCGSQIFRSLVPSSATYQGIDTADARERFGYAMPDTRYFEGDDWGVPDESYDVALCTEVLEHIPDPRGFLARAHACLRPGGRLVLTVPFAARWHFIPYDYWRYTPSGLILLLSAAGFTDIVIWARGNPLTVACYKTMTLMLMPLLGTGRGLGRAGAVLLGLILLPVAGLLACIANLSLCADWGEDCLGYTVTAQRGSREGPPPE